MDITGVAGVRWSASILSPGWKGLPHRWQTVAVSLTILDRRLYGPEYWPVLRLVCALLAFRSASIL